MNVAKAIEMAFSQVVRKYADLGSDVTVRAWQSLPVDGSWDEEKDRSFPMLDIRCSPPRVDENQRTLYAECAILCGTKVDDDLNHAKVSALYGSAQDVCDALFGQYVNTAGDELNEFKAVLSGELGAGFNFGGLSWGEGMVPVDQDGLNIMGIVVRVHYSRADY